MLPKPDQKYFDFIDFVAARRWWDLSNKFGTHTTIKEHEASYTKQDVKEAQAAAEKMIKVVNKVMIKSNYSTPC